MTHRTGRITLALALSTMLAACGEPTDRPEDCNGDEFFDDVSQLCTACAVVDEPDCRFGFSIVSDEETACPVAQCNDTSTCELYERFDETTLTCSRRCPDGAGVDASGACVACPTLDCEGGTTSCAGAVGDDGCAELSCESSCG